MPCIESICNGNKLHVLSLKKYLFELQCFPMGLKYKKFPRIMWEKSKRIQKTHKNKNFGLLDGCKISRNGLENGMQYMHDMLIDSTMNEVFSKHQCIMAGERYEPWSHIILHMMHQTTKCLLQIRNLL